MNPGDVVYYIDGGEIRSGVLKAVTEPQDEGGQKLYELGSGLSVPQIFDTEEEAKNA